MYNIFKSSIFQIFMNCLNNTLQFNVKFTCMCCSTWKVSTNLIYLGSDQHYLIQFFFF